MLDNLRSRVGQVARVLRAEGVSGAGRRARRLGHRLLGEQTEQLPLLAADVADSTRLGPVAEPVLVSGRPLRIGWITAPPGAGSGGHTTMFRMIEGLERAGHDNRLYLYDTSHSDVARHERVIRDHWPAVKATVHDVASGTDAMDADVWIATSWQTAHVLASRPHLPGRRMYFVQDYEPYFYAHGSLYALAEDTYRFGFTGITAGAWLAEELADRFGMHSTHFDFGADLGIYSAASGTDRQGVVFYTKPSVPRRGHDTGMLALEDFARARPEVPIHLFGDPVARVPFEAVNHGRLSPTRLNELYNTCRVGLSLSFTNVSLIPWELLASGVVPVVNDARHNRIVLQSPGVAWSAASPAALSRAMQAAFDGYDPVTTPGRLERTVADASWAGAADAVTAFVEAQTLDRA
ncbi:hypothetical protein GCM10027413_00680 [Conyzicola nivalis]|uniref:Glycosyltransferase family 1 protein n=1 Tax=Conyzicola nivalis TaxID=1477021 RepID=A0A916SNX1_9MICO|nr:glycosyltransferase family 1 protein [Conyzicola nivalis]GGB10158.1 hypothetical protein GCM10010979_25960 [Conyzicola nivalis]